MRFDLFEAMSVDDAANVLAEFMNRGPVILSDERIDPEQISLTDLPSQLLRIGLRLQTVPIEADQSVPEYIRNSDDYRDGLFEFSEDSKRLIVGAAYLIGNVFVRHYSKLSWGSGNPDYATGNMPVVRGFSSGDELAPLLVANNLFRKFVKNRATAAGFETCVERWATSV